MPDIGELDIARNWGPLCEALQQHVRIPLLNDHEDDWKRLNPRESEFKWNVSRDLAHAHYLTKEVSMSSVLWYTLLYGCMHFDVLNALMNTDEFKEVLNSQSGIHSNILHVDFGCGPGTSAWSVVKNLPATVRIATIGHDHNLRMTNLATAMVQTISQSAPKDVVFDFFSSWSGFHKQVLNNTKQQDIVLVTANSLFGQQSFTSSHLDEIIDLIRNIRTESQTALIMIYGTHPPYNRDTVERTWQRIAEEMKSSAIYNQDLSVSSWSPIRCNPDIQSSWHLWENLKPQLARILVLRPAGGKR